MAGLSMVKTSGGVGRRALAIVAALLATTAAALAHPHVMIVAKAAFVLDSSGRIAAIRHRWTFDEAYSAMAVAGMKTTPEGKVAPEELKDLAKLNVESLSEFRYFTTLKQGGKALAFQSPAEGYVLEQDGPALTLTFVLPLKTPVRPANGDALRVDDETFFVAFSFAEGEPVTIEGTSACKVEIKRPARTPDQGTSNLGEDFFSNLKSSFTDDFATIVRLRCP